MCLGFQEEITILGGGGGGGYGSLFFFFFLGGGGFRGHLKIGQFLLVILKSTTGTCVQ